MSIRRRRRGLTILPGPAGRIGGGFARPTAPSTNYNNGVYGAGPYGQQQGSGNAQTTQGRTDPGTPPPPPYSSSKNDAVVSEPDGYAPPPGPPPEAHINDGVRMNTLFFRTIYSLILLQQGHNPWYKGNQ